MFGRLSSIFAISFVCLGTLLGVLNAYLQFDVPILLIVVGCVVLIVKFKTTALFYLLLLLLSYNIGFARADGFRDDWEYVIDSYGQEVVVEGVIVDDPSYHYSKQFEFHIDQVEQKEPEGRSISGLIRIRSYQASSLKRGDTVTVSGKVYKALGNRNGSIQYADVDLVTKNTSWVESFRLGFFASTYSVLPDPESSLGLGFLVGLRNLLPDSLNENLRATGLTHIVAVSGYNLTILVFLTRRLLAKYSKFIATTSAVALVVFFLAITGGAPSIIRASIVAGLSLSAWYYGRTTNPLILLLMSAAISALINPFYVWRDIGWYLSFAAFFGVLVIAPLIIKRFYKKPPKLIGQLLIETTCAQLMTLPIIMFIFGDVSVISVLANLIVLPLIPIAMATTFVAGITYMFSTTLAFVVAIPAKFVLSFIVEASAYMAQVPWALVSLNLTALQMALSYILILAICGILYRTNVRRSNVIELDTLY